MQRSDLVTMAADRLRDPNHDVFSADYLCRALNEGMSRVVGASPWWPFLEVREEAANELVSAGTNSFTLPTDAWNVTALFNSTDNLPMREITGDDTPYTLYPERTQSPGTPVYFRIFNDTIEVFPYPASDTQFLVEYEVSPSQLTSDSSVPAFPSEYHGMLVEYAMYLAYTDDGNLQQAQAHLAQFETRLAEMKNDLLGSRGPHFEQINDNFF